MIGVLYDEAQGYYQLSLANQIGDATPTLHLYSSDDTPTPSIPPSTYTELGNDSYSPLPVPNGFWQFLTSPPPDHYAILGAAWDLAPPGIFGDDTIFGWWLDCFSPRLGFPFPLYGGRFDPPIVIPPAGLSLTLNQVNLYLHDCGTVPPPPPPPGNAWITNLVSITSTRNNFNGYVGCKFTTASSVTVLQLGRYVLGSSADVHDVRIVRASDGHIMCQVSVDCSTGVPGSFQYANIPTPTVLAASTDYYLASLEFVGGDLWYDQGLTVATTAVAACDDAVFSNDGITFSLIGAGATHSFVPCNFKYS